MEKEEIETEKTEKENIEKENMEEILPKRNKKKKIKLSDWFQIGSFRRICMVVLSYILLLAFLCSSFFSAAYFYWFGAETSNHYSETKRFQERMQSKMEDVIPALKQYLQQGILDSNEMVEIYTLTAEENKEGKVVDRWRKSTSYTCESGAKIAGFQTSVRNKEKGVQLYYEKQSDEFSLFRITDGQVIDFTDNHFIKRWEDYYYNRGHEGTQKYCAISSNTMKEWMLKYANLNGEYYYYQHVPEDVRWIECSYHANEDTRTILCYSEQKDRWYYLTGNDRQGLEKKAFYMPDMVYFPLYSVEENDSSNAQSLVEFSNGFNEAALYLKQGLLYQRSKSEKAINGESILEVSPFFNLKTILYEAGKEYYYQKMLLQYIDRKMDGYLWEFCFHSDLEDTRIAINDISADNTMYYEEFFVDCVLNQEDEGFASVLMEILEPQGYYAVTVSLALPQYSMNMAEVLSGTMPQGQELRYSLENMIFRLGHQKSGIIWIGFAILSLIIYGMLLIRLLFEKGEKIFEIQGLKEKKVVTLARFDYLPTELMILITILFILGIIIITDGIGNFNWSWLMDVLVLFFSCTVAYFLCYILAASFIRRIRANILWKNSLTARTITWVWKKGGQCFYKIWKNSNWKRKTVILLFGYLIGSIFCGGCSIISFIIMIVENGNFFIVCIFFLLIFAGLQIKAISYVIKNEIGTEQILEGIKQLSLGNLEYEMNMQGLSGEYLEMAQTLPKIRDGLNTAIQKSLRDERMKTELITNVSHDIKTPLTSIINYIDLLKRAKPQGENVEHYLEVLTQKSERLRHLIEDLVEASKASSGTLPLDKKNLNLIELIQQIMGEFEEKLELRKLLLLIHCPEIPVIIFADGQRMFRIMENLFQNLYKYALEGTRVYLDLEIASVDQDINFDKNKEKKAVLTLRNISAAPLNISEEELTERFVRGEESRTTEGSGLGLSIAKDLVTLQGGKFWLKIDGDLFKVIMEFPIVEIGSDV